MNYEKKTTENEPLETLGSELRNRKITGDAVVYSVRSQFQNEKYDSLTPFEKFLNKDGWKIFVILGLILILAGGGYWAYIEYASEEIPAVITKSFPAGTQRNRRGYSLTVEYSVDGEKYTQELYTSEPRLTPQGEYDKGKTITISILAKEPRKIASDYYRKAIWILAIGAICLVIPLVLRLRDRNGGW